ncbi:unnamed protein product [Urochloa humidicola]
MAPSPTAVVEAVAGGLGVVSWSTLGATDAVNVCGRRDPLAASWVGPGLEMSVATGEDGGLEMAKLCISVQIWRSLLRGASSGFSPSRKDRAGVSFM